MQRVAASVLRKALYPNISLLRKCEQQFKYDDDNAARSMVQWTKTRCSKPKQPKYYGTLTKGLRLELNHKILSSKTVPMI
jgi:hypothetical protein